MTSRHSIILRTITLSITACVAGCGSEHSVNADSQDFRLSHASNNIADQGAWSIDESNLDERWDQDPSIMEPDFPSSGPQPGFGSDN
ncbi:MAG: hypothetical protein EXS01_05110 [Phycisphaerales bacterium]|nr:hypothetical protein [Phycisphaerales bacterium]